MSVNDHIIFVDLGNFLIPFRRKNENASRLSPEEQGALLADFEDSKLRMDTVDLRGILF